MKHEKPTPFAEKISSDSSSVEPLSILDAAHLAAKTDQRVVIYGIPILDVEEARTMLFVARSMAWGYVGVDNEPFVRPNTRCYSATRKR